MAEKKLLTRIIMNHGEWASYAGKTAKDGEVIYVKVGTTQANGKVSEPIWMQKIGDGTTQVQNLPWVVAPAADVYEWAKKASLDVADIPELPADKLPELGITLKTEGEGNAVTSVAYDAATKTFTVTKGETFATKKEFDEHKHNITATDDDVIIATGGELSVDVKHKEELGEVYTTTATETAQAPKFGESATINVPKLEVNKYGHITKAKDQEVKISIPGLNEVAESSHTHTDGKGTKVTGDGAKAIDLNIKLDLATEGNTKYLKVLDKDSETEIAKLDATEFIKDGMIESVVLSDDGLNLVITWNTDSDKGESNITTIPLSGLVDVYTGVDGTTIKVEVSSDNKIGAEVKTNSIKDGHIATDAAIARTKLASDVQTSLGLADTALQAHQNIDHKADKVEGATVGNFAGLDAEGNLTDSGSKASDFATADHNHDDEYVKLGDPITIGTEDNGTVLSGGGVSFNDDMGSASLGTDGININTHNTYFNIKVSAGELQEASMSEDIALGLNQSLKAVTKAGTGLKVTETGSEGAKEYQMDIDETVVFILDGGNASNLD